jgi:ATP-dependent Clp protease adaptor protein ClpS
MEKVHSQNQAIIGTYPYDIAATRMSLAIQDARQNGFPLRCEMEEG